MRNTLVSLIFATVVLSAGSALAAGAGTGAAGSADGGADLQTLVGANGMSDPVGAIKGAPWPMGQGTSITRPSQSGGAPVTTRF